MSVTCESIVCLLYYGLSVCLSPRPLLRAFAHSPPLLDVALAHSPSRRATTCERMLSVDGAPRSSASAVTPWQLLDLRYSHMSFPEIKRRASVLETQGMRTGRAARSCRQSIRLQPRMPEQGRRGGSKTTAASCDARARQRRRTVGRRAYGCRG